MFFFCVFPSNIKFNLCLGVQSFETNNREDIVFLVKNSFSFSFFAIHLSFVPCSTALWTNDVELTTSASRLKWTACIDVGDVLATSFIVGVVDEFTIYGFR